jgi:hypothetical protein
MRPIAIALSRRWQQKAALAALLAALSAAACSPGTTTSGQPASGLGRGLELGRANVVTVAGDRPSDPALLAAAAALLLDRAWITRG